MDLESLKQKVIDGDAKGVTALTQQALDEGVPAQSIFNDVLIPGMGVVGELFEKNEYFVPELLLAARAMYRPSTCCARSSRRATTSPPARRSSALSRATCTTSARSWS